MNKRELEKWLHELEEGKRDLGKISRQESIKMIVGVTKDLLNDRKSRESDANIDYILRIIELYDNMEGKFDIAIQQVKKEISQLNSI
jgi:hypothetical protein